MSDSKRSPDRPSHPSATTAGTGASGVTAPNREAMERAVSAFLEAAGIPDDPELAQTPERVVAAWVDEFIDGYQKDPIAALGVPSPVPQEQKGAVFVTGIDYTGVCPHHLLPYRGVAHIGYLPGESVAGFSRLAALLDVYAHRLTLQETLAQQVAEALVEGLGARGAGVILEAEQLCMTLRGVKRTRSRAVVEASVGEFGRAELDRLWTAAGRK